MIYIYIHACVHTWKLAFTAENDDKPLDLFGQSDISPFWPSQWNPSTSSLDDEPLDSFAVGGCGCMSALQVGWDIMRMILCQYKLCTIKWYELWPWSKMPSTMGLAAVMCDSIRCRVELRPLTQLLSRTGMNKTGEVQRNWRLLRFLLFTVNCGKT